MRDEWGGLPLKVEIAWKATGRSTLPASEGSAPMSKHNGDLVRSAGEHVFALFRDAAEDAPLVYHGFSRTRELVDACTDIAKGNKLDDQASEVVLLSAWFYDACYAMGSDDHGKSLELCRQFLEHHQVRHRAPDQIAACFRGLDGADPKPRDARDGVPRDHYAPSDVLYDGRLALLAGKDYVEQSELLRLELERRSGKTFSDIEWTQRCIASFDAHPYRTSFAQLEFGSQRAANLVRLHKLLRRQVKEAEEAHADAEKLAKGVGRTIENMFWYLTRSQVALFGLADRRTSTMVHVNAIMLSIVVALLVRRLDVDRYLVVPTLLLLTVNMATIFVSIYSMRSARAKLAQEEARRHDTNFLVFSNDLPVSLAEYAERMNRLFADRPEFQRRMIEHMYFVRKLLADRARALRITYDVFIYGLALAIIAFAVALIRR